VSDTLGKRRWAIAEGYIPSWPYGPEPQFTSRETACLQNTSDEDAHVTITAYFSDQEPGSPYRVTVPARRTLHLRFNELKDPKPVLQGRRLHERDRVRRPDNGAAHPARLAPGRECAALHHRVREQRLTGMFIRGWVFRETRACARSLYRRRIRVG